MILSKALEMLWKVLMKLYRRKESRALLAPKEYKDLTLVLLDL